MSESEKKLVLTVKETANLLGTSVRTVWTMIEEKDLSTLNNSFFRKANVAPS